MQIQYNFELNRWECPYSQFFWGHNPQPIEQTNMLFSSPLQFELRQNGDKIGPLIGVVVERNEANQLTGDIQFLQILQETLIEKNALMIVFSIQDFYINGVKGYIFSPLTNRWYHIQTPLPNIIYNRLSTKKYHSEETNKFIVTCKKLDVPILNSHFLTIEQTLKTILSSYTLRGYFPITKYVNSLEELITSMQMNHQLVLIGPTHTMPSHTTLMELTNYGEVITFRNGKKKVYSTYEGLQEDYYYLFYPYKMFYQENKQIGDKFTVLYHKKEEGYYLVLIQSLKKEKELKKHYPFFEMIGQKIAKQLIKQISYLMEFALDIYFENNNYFVTFVYTKPILSLTNVECKTVAASLSGILINLAPFSPK